MPEEPAPIQPSETAPVPPPKKRFFSFNKKLVYIVLAGLLVIALAGLAWWHWHGNKPAAKVSTTVTAKPAASVPAIDSSIPGLKLDSSKNYGNKYASGVLPVGDNKYKTDAAAVGYIYVCSGYAHNLSVDAGGAGSRGPWFVGTTQYDLSKKAHVQGSVSWTPSFSDTISGSTRLISSNGLPNHTTGTFPIARSDPAYAYDKNPNSIAPQSLSYSLALSPTYGNPQCEGGQVGIMNTGVALFNGFDAGGRDAGAWEVQDSCDGHPEKTGVYHYHTLSSCIKDISVSSVIGFALDGYPITGPQVGTNNILTTSDLDECHGIVSQIVLDGKKVTTYHYVMTQDFPYSVSCFRSTPISPPGQPAQPH